MEFFGIRRRICTSAIGETSFKTLDPENLDISLPTTMSSLQRQQMSLSSPFESVSKKKFGKNLNKLQKPAPPIANSGTNKSGSSNNGLLLLSTKRSPSTSGNLASPGLLASKVSASTSSTKAIQPVVVRSEFYTSTHEALMDAVSGISKKDREQQPDAWRVSDVTEEYSSPSVLPSKEATVSDANPMTSVDTVDKNGRNDSYDGNDQRHADRQRYETNDGESWRRQPPPFEPVESNVGDARPLHMSTLARERAERIRNEEETRMKEQRERATQRLRELEEKMAALPAAPSSPQEPQAFTSPIALKKDESVKGINNTLLDDTNTFQRRTTSTPRALFDPNRTYSSLVGRKEPDINQDDSKHIQLPPPISPIIQSTPVVDAMPESSVIHLSSYDDRNRGEIRGNTAAPRMLFDPRSGSMVAVTNDKAKKSKPIAKVRNIRESPVKSESGDHLKLIKKNVKVRKDEAPDIRKGLRCRGNSVDSPSTEVKNSKTRVAKMRPTEPRLPRTCGVLYVRDSKGNVSCADGTDPEQYGSHLVRGGKIRNPAAHAKFLEDGEIEEEIEPDDEFDVGTRYEGYNTKDYGLNGNIFEFVVRSPEKVELVKGDDKIELLTGAPESPTLKATAMEWAPSQSAMAAAAAAKGIIGKGGKHHTSASIDSVASGSIGFHSDNESDDVDPASFVGLGFDPTENMDSVMASPATYPRTGKEFDDDAFTSLTMEAVHPSAASTTSQNIFAFGLSGTWGSSAGVPLTGSADNWGAILGSASEKSREVGPSFISLSSNNTWGSGFGGLSGGNTTGD